MLYQRVKEVAQKYCGSDSRLASLLNIKQNTFSQYLNESRQDKLWPYLDKILKLFPEINRYWLYHGEGDMLGNTLPLIFETQKEKEELLQQLKILEKKLEEERMLNKKLVNRLLLEGSPQHGSECGQTSEAAG